ncbi:MAG: hypothetical protein CENE_00248 [Candidatus Celerinatantimonas neptuna]|nr:MAG: hypothetical protein CENE_00248 [Candidatus Celerinatantimonas neptuna]
MLNIKNTYMQFKMYGGLSSDVYAIAAAHLILGISSFIVSFLILMLTLKINYSPTISGLFIMGSLAIQQVGKIIGGKSSDSIPWSLVSSLVILFLYYEVFY